MADAPNRGEAVESEASWLLTLRSCWAVVDIARSNYAEFRLCQQLLRRLVSNLHQLEQRITWLSFRAKFGTTYFRGYPTQSFQSAEGKASILGIAGYAGTAITSSPV